MVTCPARRDAVRWAVAEVGARTDFGAECSSRDSFPPPHPERRHTRVKTWTARTVSLDLSVDTVLSLVLQSERQGVRLKRGLNHPRSPRLARDVLWRLPQVVEYPKDGC